MLHDGFCVIPDILNQDLIDELRRETDRLNVSMDHHPDTKYQGTHLGIKFEDNAIMQRLGDWPPARQALEDLGSDDFDHSGSLLVLTKEPHTSALYWHQIGCDGTTRSVALLGRKRCFSPITLRKHESKMAV